MKKLWHTWQTCARKLKTELRVLIFASRDQRIPARTRWLALCVVAYALSPLDLIPDFIPVVGLIDDAILLPLGIAFVLKTIPPEIMQEYRERAVSSESDTRLGRIGAAIIVVLWLLGLLFLVNRFLIWRK